MNQPPLLAQRPPAPAAEQLASWYAPWRHAHPSWLEDEGGRWMSGGAPDELLLRARYPAWCRRWSLPPHPDPCADSLWWTLYAMDAAPFARAGHLAGLVLAIAADRRSSFLTVRRAAALLPNRDDLKWALQRASLVPKTVLDLIGAAARDELARPAAASLAFALERAMPCLKARMALRFPRPWAGMAPADLEPEEASRCVRWFERLWFGALERLGPEQ